MAGSCHSKRIFVMISPLLYTPRITLKIQVRVVVFRGSTPSFHPLPDRPVIREATFSPRQTFVSSFFSQ